MSSAPYHSLKTIVEKQEEVKVKQKPKEVKMKQLPHLQTVSLSDLIGEELDFDEKIKK